MTGWTVAASAVIAAGTVLLLFGVGWALGQNARPWPGPDSLRGPLVILGSGAVLMVGGFVWAVIVA